MVQFENKQSKLSGRETMVLFTAIAEYVSTGRPARGIGNRIIRDLGPISTAVPAFPLAAAALAPLRAKAESEGSGDFSPLWAGQNANACREVAAADLTQQQAASL